MTIEVYKFGGVAVGSPDAIRAALGHIRRGIEQPKNTIATVVSAMNGVTDLLLDAAHAAERGDRETAATAARAFYDRHAALIPELIKGSARAKALRELLTSVTDEMRSMTDSVAVLRE